MEGIPKTFTLILSGSTTNITLEYPVPAGVVTLREVSIIAMDVAGSAANPVIGIDLPYFGTSLDNNYKGHSRLLVFPDPSKVLTVYHPNISYTIFSSIPKTFKYKCFDEIADDGTSPNFSTEIKQIALTFEYVSTLSSDTDT